MTIIKVCGITNIEDAVAAVAAGAGALGFNFYRPSPRYITPPAARKIIEQLPDSVLSTGVLVNESVDSVKKIGSETGIKAVQLHGDESPDDCRALAKDFYVIKTLAVSAEFDAAMVQAYEVEAIMLDTGDSALRGGTGRAFDWSIAQQVKKLVGKLFLAGGLSPENVAEAIASVRPYAVDVCSALENVPGRKNHARMRAFVESAKSVKP